jgi:hypothetical protein
MEGVLTDTLLQKRLSENARLSITTRFERATMWEAIYKEYQSLDPNI